MKLPHRRRFLHLAAGTAVLPAVSRVAWAQAYPTRPITMIVPIAAGSSSDVGGRLVAERMGTALGQPIIIENVPGARRQHWRRPGCSHTSGFQSPPMRSAAMVRRL
jgi:hypothetical protein